jgi:hypothetical protein
VPFPETVSFEKTSPESAPVSMMPALWLAVICDESMTTSCELFTWMPWVAEPPAATSASVTRREEPIHTAWAEPPVRSRPVMATS